MELKWVKYENSGNHEAPPLQHYFLQAQSNPSFEVESIRVVGIPNTVTKGKLLLPRIFALVNGFREARLDGLEQ